MQYGVIKGVTKLDAEVSSVKRGYAFVDFKDSISVKRTFTNKIFIKGKHVKVTLSKLGMELILSRSVVFFYEAHNYINIKTLEKYFEQYGQVFRYVFQVHMFFYTLVTIEIILIKKLEGQGSKFAMPL